MAVGVTQLGSYYGALHVKQTDNTNAGGLVIERSDSTATGRMYVDGSNNLIVARGGGSAADTWVFTTAGTVGIGKTPSTDIRLDVDGALRISNTTATCDSNRSGGVRWNGTEFQVCYGSGGWATLANSSVSGTLGGGDRIVSGTAYAIMNSSGLLDVSGSLNINRGAPTGASIASFAISGTSESAGLSLFAYTSDHSVDYLKSTAMFYLPAVYTTKDILLNAPSSTAAIRFHVGGSFNNPAFERMRITANGNVGISTNAPSATLDVSGTVKLAGTGSDPCADIANHGTLRVDPVSGKLQMCRTK